MSHPSQQDKNNTDPRFRVDDLEVDTGKAVVTRKGVELPLPKLSFDLLCALIESAPSIATTDSLLDRVWPGLVVNPETVAARVKLLRDVIGDDPKQPRYILAVRARGYRLIPPVERLLDSQAVEQSPPPSSAEHVSPSLAVRADVGSDTQLSSRTRTFAVAWIAGVAILAALTAGLVIVRMHAPPPHRLTEIPQVAVEKATLPARTVAVLPFASLGGQPADELVAAGFAESIRLRLGSLSQVIVIASRSSAAYNGKNVNATTIGRELNARYLLEGTLQRQNGSLRITAHLVDADNGQDVWSVAFDRRSSDIFSIEDGISARVARALQVTLDARDLERRQNPGAANSQGTANLDAYLEYLQARGYPLWTSLKLPDLQNAIQHYQRAIELDPTLSAAYSGLAEARLNTTQFGEFDQSKWKSVQAAVRQLTAKALQLDSRNAEAYRAMADVEDDPTRREIYNRHAVALEPNSGQAQNTLAEDIALSQLGTSPSAVDEALFHLDKATEIDPLDAGYPAKKADILLYQRPTEIAEVEPLLLRSLDRDPNSWALESLALLRFVQGREAAAAKLMEQAFLQSQDPTSSFYIDSLAHIYVSVGDVTAAENLIAPSKFRPLRVITLVARREWEAAALLVYLDNKPLSAVGGYNDGLSAMDILTSVFAVRMAAHQNHQLARARKLLEDSAQVKWDAHGSPITQVPMWYDMTAAVGLADILLLSGETERARKLLEMSLSSMDTAAFEFKRGNFWFWLQRSRVMAMLGRDEESLAALEHVANSGDGVLWIEVDVDPAFDHLRLEPRFQGFLSERKRHTAEQLALVQLMREKGEIPSRASK
jgi:TolB-like protein/DNA-binding winged helix-turn-helix (wHTH) protein/Flp pilus assembly protein TadD